MSGLTCGVSVLDYTIVQATTTSVLVFLLAADEEAHPGRAISLREWHHYYLGLALVALGIMLDSLPLRAVGCLLCIDDAWQHSVQVFLCDPGFRSPLAWLYAQTLWRIPLVRRLNRWLDGVFS